MMRAITASAVILMVAVSLIMIPFTGSGSDGADSGSSDSPVSNCTVTMVAPNVWDIWVYAGGHVEVNFVDGDNCDFNSSYPNSDSMVKSGYQGSTISGNPTSDVVVEVLFVDLSLEEERTAYFTIHCVVPTTSTAFAEDRIYLVEGDSVELSVTGSVSNGVLYRADLSADGGTLGTQRVESGVVFTYTAPQVDGTTVFRITATSVVDNTQQSSDVLEVVVVDALEEGNPSVGRITSA